MNILLVCYFKAIALRLLRDENVQTSERKRLRCIEPLLGGLFKKHFMCKHLIIVLQVSSDAIVFGHVYNVLFTYGNQTRRS